MGSKKTLPTQLARASTKPNSTLDKNKIVNCGSNKSCDSCKNLSVCEKTGFKFDMEIIEVKNYIKSIPRKEML